MTQPELSIVIPFLSEKRVLPLLRERFENIAKRSDFWELIFVSDGSTDGSTEYVEDWSRVNPAVKLVVLTRNFGHQYAVSAGLALTSGRYRSEEHTSELQSQSNLVCR